MSGNDIGARVLARRFHAVLTAPAILLISTSAVPAGQVVERNAAVGSEAKLRNQRFNLVQSWAIRSGTPSGDQNTKEFMQIPAAEPFLAVSGDAVSLGRARDCMTQAIYYEAGTESADGQRAVAQVVLNRVRHTAFPKSICGVIYQGSQLSTGCQFTFTCDGSLARKPSASGWERARRVAEEALAGRVFPEVGLATHYHASYVAPYWSSSLFRIGTVGSHIFYRWRGTAGTPSAFTSRYSGVELVPEQISPDVGEPRLEAELALTVTPDPKTQLAPRALNVLEEELDRPAGAPVNLGESSVPPNIPALVKPRPLAIASNSQAVSANLD